MREATPHDPTNQHDAADVDTLTGTALDYAVALCEQETPPVVRMNPYGFWVLPNTPPYSTDWAAGGPIMEREKIGISYFRPDAVSTSSSVIAARSTDYGKTMDTWSAGNTALIAGMRCHVTRMLGPLVSLPRVLIATDMGTTGPVVPGEKTRGPMTDEQRTRVGLRMADAVDDVQVVINSMGDVLGAQRFAASVDPVRLVTAWQVGLIDVLWKINDVAHDYQAEITALRAQVAVLQRQLDAVDARLGFPTGHGDGRIELLEALQAQVVSEADRRAALAWAESAGARAESVDLMQDDVRPEFLASIEKSGERDMREARRLLKLTDPQEGQPS